MAADEWFPISSGQLELICLATDDVPAGTFGQLSLLESRVFVNKALEIKVSITPSGSTSLRSLRRTEWKLDDGEVIRILRFSISAAVDNNPLWYKSYDKRDTKFVEMLKDDDNFFSDHLDLVCNEDQTILCFCEDVVIGFLTFDGRDEANICAISVFSPYRQKGYGRLMVYDFEAAVVEFNAGEPCSPAHASKVSKEAIPFWEAIGWRVSRNGAAVGNYRPSPGRVPALEPMLNAMASTE